MEIHLSLKIQPGDKIRAELGNRLTLNIRVEYLIKLTELKYILINSKIKQDIMAASKSKG